MEFIDTNSKQFFLLNELSVVLYFCVEDGVISIDEFEILITKYFRMAPFGLRELFDTFGKK
jgi:hypothetical protein